MSQADLAARMGTKQPAIARLESGVGNVGTATIVAAAKALGATIRIDLEPEEMLGAIPMVPRWWDRMDVVAFLGAPSEQIVLDSEALQQLGHLEIGGNCAIYGLLDKPASVSEVETPFVFERNG